MAYELKDNSGSIFRNDKREKDTHPHGTGKCMIDGVLYYVSAWTKEGANGRFQSLSFKRADAKPEQAAPQRAQKAKPDFSNMDDDAPF
jgi:hypothetical protein